MERGRTIDDLDDPDGLYGGKDKKDDVDDSGGDGLNDDFTPDFVPERLEDLVNESSDDGAPVKKAVVPPARRGAAGRKADGEQRLAALLVELKGLDQRFAEDGGEVDQRDRGLTLSPKNLLDDLPLTLRSLRLHKKERYELDATRPRTRADCIDGPRPCVRVSCQWHPYLDVNPETGAIKLNFPHLAVHELPTTCILDAIEAAGDDGLTMERVGEILNLTRERVRQREVRALIKMQAANKAEEDLAKETAAARTQAGQGNGISEQHEQVTDAGDNSAADLGIDFTPLKLD